VTLWYKIEVQYGFKELIDDNGAMEMVELAKCFGKVELYVEPGISQPVFAADTDDDDDVVVVEPEVVEDTNVDVEDNVAAEEEVVEEEAANEVMDKKGKRKRKKGQVIKRKRKQKPRVDVEEEENMHEDVDLNQEEEGIRNEEPYVIDESYWDESELQGDKSDPSVDTLNVDEDAYADEEEELVTDED
jgi:hypothetical protein